MLYIIQEHFASHHHFDFRIEMNNVLKSWAIPKGIPIKKGEKHLAIEVEDHPLEYAEFEGEIPEGHYGAGIVKIWDKGRYNLVKKEKGKIEIYLKGEKIEGLYELVFFKNDKGKNYWLIFRKND